jgi:monovalent cation:H+ antiporter, CPA1 family
LLIEAESLLNDGTAAVAFVAVLGVLAGEQQSVLSLCGSLILTIGGGALVGALAGWVSCCWRIELRMFWWRLPLLRLPLIGAQEAQEHFIGLWIPILVAIALVTLGRAVAIYPVCLLFVHSRLKVERRDQHILFWGGLRGALALALALPADLPYRDATITLTFAVVAFCVFAQGLTITPLLRRLGQILSD